MAMTIFMNIASLSSIIGLAIQLIRHKEKPFTYVLLVIAFVCSIFSAVLFSENLELKNARKQADKLVSSWPKVDKFDYVSAGEFRGIVFAGLAFLEAHKDLFPEAYSATKSLMESGFGVSTNNERYYTDKRDKLEEAATTMVSIIKSIQVN